MKILIEWYVHCKILAQETFPLLSFTWNSALTRKVKVNMKDQTNITKKYFLNKRYGWPDNVFKTGSVKIVLLCAIVMKVFRFFFRKLCKKYKLIEVVKFVNTLSLRKMKWHVTHDMLHATPFIWHMKHDKWHITYAKWFGVFIVLKSQLSTSNRFWSYDKVSCLTLNVDGKNDKKMFQTIISSCPFIQSKSNHLDLALM